MKKLITIFTLVFLNVYFILPQIASAQAPQKMSFQAVIRNSNDALVISKAVGMRISVLKGTSTGASVYTETQTPTTNGNGQTSFEIGAGTVVSGNFATINWAAGPYFIKTETDPTGGTNYTIGGTSQLLSVPYALFSANGSSGASNTWTLNGSDISNTNAGKVGIGTSTPDDKLTVKTNPGNFGISHTDGDVTVGTFIGSGYGWFGTKSNHPLAFYTNNSVQQLTLVPNGNFGIGTADPQARLHVAGDVKIDGSNTLEFGAGIAGKEVSAGKIGYKAFGTFDALDIAGAGTSGLNRKIRFWNEGGAEFRGNVGIGIAATNNKLQIGSLGNVGYSGNDIAIGNGNNATGFAQTDAYLQVASSVDIVFLPRAYQGQGRVGINTYAPRATLDVSDYNGMVNPNIDNQYAYFAYGKDVLTNSFPSYKQGGVQSATIPDVSIIAAGRIVGTEFNAYSDARIKSVIGVSDAAKDLDMLNAIKITDYTMKDKVKFGNQTFKKVIAQEVEKVYPQVVSKHTDYIPNVYQVASKVEKTATGYLLTFADKHNISNTAKNLRILLPEGTQIAEITEIPSDNQVVIKSIDLKSDKAFVYGEEVNDFRTIDYEGLSTLNISATQELSKLVKAQQVIIENQQKQLDLMEKRLTSWQASK
jgi:uncharacterized coiled-coil protein SlyX